MAGSDAEHIPRRQKVTLELLRKKDHWFVGIPVPYRLGGVQEITGKTKYGENHFSITIFDTRVFFTDAFTYIKNADTGEYFVKDGKWVGYEL